MVALDESASITLDASGGGIARIGPGRAGTRWRVTAAAVLSPGNPSPIPRVYLYKGEPAPGSHITSSYNGNQNSTDLDMPLHAGQYLSAQWIGGLAGARYTLSVFGERSG